MDKLQRNERIAIMVKILSHSPCKVFTLGYFTEMFGSAKSTVSEDIDILGNIMHKFQLGNIDTIPGASGGVRFMPAMSSANRQSILESLCHELSKKERILPGGYLYMLDIIYNPEIATNIGCILASHFFTNNVQYVVTVETKGIPIAFATAKCLNVPLIIVRHSSEATDGASVSTNYVSGSSKKIQTMALSLKALKRGSRLLFVDDFMKGGGTARGIMELAKEFECEVIGIGVLIETLKPEKKLVDKYFSLLTLDSIDETSFIVSAKNEDASV